MKKLITVICIVMLSFAGISGLFAAGSEESGVETGLPYEGTVLRIALISGYTECPPIHDALVKAGDQLGATIEVSWYSVDELHDKLMLDFMGNNKVWDIVFVHAPSRGEWIDSGLIIPIERYMRENPDLVDPELNLSQTDFNKGAVDLYTYKDEWIGPPLFETGVCLFYRQDLFESTAEKAAFSQAFGYELDVPQTYAQYMDIAEFFTRSKGETLAGEVLDADFYGIAHSNKPVGFLWYDFMNYLLGFGADNIFNPETMIPTFNSEEAIAAGEFYVDLCRNYAPPGHMAMASGQSTALFAEGNVAMIQEFFTRGLSMAMNPEVTSYADTVGVAINPIREGVVGRDHAAIKGGNVIAMYGLSQNKEAAFKAMELAFSKDIMKDVFLETYAPYDWIPPRLSVIDDPEVQAEAFWADIVGSKLMVDDIYYFDAPALLEYPQAMDIAGTALSHALTGKVSVREAFTEAQKDLLDLFKETGLID